MDVDWQNNFHHIKDRGLHLLQSEKWSDCRFLVGGTNQRLISGHKLFLAITSPVFERMFFGNLPDTSDPIVIPDVQPDAFQALLEYIYSDTLNIESFDKACELCYVAKKYMLPHVVERCTHFLWADLSPKNACRAFEFAKLFDEPRLMQSSMEIIAAKTREVLNDPSFVDIEPSTLMAILEQDRLNIDSELDLFNALLRYATECGPQINEQKCFLPDRGNTYEQGDQEENVEVMVHNCETALDDQVNVVEEIKMEPDVNAMINDPGDEATIYHDGNNIADDVLVVESDLSGTETDTDAVKTSTPITNDNLTINNGGGQHHGGQNQRCCETILRQAVKKIRFLTMTPQQFAEGPARSKLLQQHEALAILIKISSPSIDDCPMPEGFCSSRCCRNYYEPRNPRELSSYRHSFVTSANAVANSVVTCAGGAVPASQFDAQFSNNSAGVMANQQQHQQQQQQQVASAAAFSHLNQYVSVSDADLPTNDTRRSYCVRTVNQQFDYRNTSVTDCGLTFQVDMNIWITGVQVPTQVLCGELMNSAGFLERYTEILYAHIQDMQGSRLTYTHCTSRVRYDSLLEISFDRPVYIYRNQVYKVFVVFNKVGWYPMYTCVPDVVCNRVKFMFNVGNPSESVRDGLIRAIVFSTPQEQSRNIID